MYNMSFLTETHVTCIDFKQYSSSLEENLKRIKLVKVPPRRLPSSCQQNEQLPHPCLPILKGPGSFGWESRFWGLIAGAE